MQAGDISVIEIKNVEAYLIKREQSLNIEFGKIQLNKKMIEFICRRIRSASCERAFRKC